MPRKKEIKRFWTPAKIFWGAISFILLVAGQLLQDRFTGWGNQMINNWLAAHQGEVLAWIFDNPFNLMSAIAILILVIVGIDYYFYIRKPSGKKRVQEETSELNSTNKSDPFEFIDRKPMDKRSHEHRWASVEVKNDTDFNIENCYVKLLDLVDLKTRKSIMQFNQRNFDWGRGMRRGADKETYRNPVKEPITLTAGDVAIFDVATTSPNNDKITFTFWQWHESEVLPIGEYEVVARIFGIWNKKQKHKDQSFILTYKGSNDIAIRKKSETSVEQGNQSGHYHTENTHLGRKDIDLEKLTLAQGGLVNYPESKYHNVTLEEYIFTVINETGQGLKKCFILLDQFWAKDDWQTNNIWRLEAKDVFDKPFRWNRTNVPADGKIDIEDNDRASFAFIELSRSSVLNVTQNVNEPFLDFRLAFLREGRGGLYTGWEHRLIISIRAKDESGNNVSVRYSIYLRPHSSKGLEDVKIVREKNEQKRSPP